MPVRYITVTPQVNLFKPAERSFGDVAIIGATDSTATGPVNTPIPVTNPDAVVDGSHPPGSGRPVDDGLWFRGALGDSVRLCFQQSPGPSKVWAVRLRGEDPPGEDPPGDDPPGDDPPGDDPPSEDPPSEDSSAQTAGPLAEALAAVARLPVQIVCLADTPVGPGEVGKSQIESLAGHVASVSDNGGDGKERIGVAMLGRGVTSPDLVTGAMSNDRMVMVSHHSTADAAAAVAGVIAGYEPHISLLLKPVSLSMDSVFSDAEHEAFDTARINTLIDPDLLPGRGIYLGEAYTLGNERPYIDIVRTIDDLSFKLKARLIRSIGNLRVTRSGLRTLVSQMTAILEPARVAGVIEGFDVFLPVLGLLDKDPTGLSDVELQQIANAQNDRTVEVLVAVDYAGAIHRLQIDLVFE